MLQKISCTMAWLELVSIHPLEKQLRCNGHCIKSKRPISELLLWDHTKVVRSKSAKKASRANYSRQLLKAIGKVAECLVQQQRVSRELY
jgi:hypothetical protein